MPHASAPRYGDCSCEDCRQLGNAMAIRGTAIGRQAGDEASWDVVTRGAIQPLLIHPTSPIWKQTAGDDCHWGLREGHLSYRWKTWMLTCWPKKIGSYEIASCNTVGDSEFKYAQCSGA